MSMMRCDNCDKLIDTDYDVEHLDGCKPMEQDAQREICEHKYVEDEEFTSGLIMIIGGNPRDMGQETRVTCSKCGDVQYIRIKDLGSLADMAKEAYTPDLPEEK